MIAAAVLTVLALPVRAAEDETPSGRQVWVGTDLSTDVWLVYSGVTLAPWSGMHDDGLRLRATGGYGAYAYSHRVPHPTEFRARVHYADILVGYLMRFGELTAKAFVGPSLIGHDIAPPDEKTVVIGEEIGFKGVVELWLNMGERGWGALDASWSTAHETRAVRLRAGYRVWPKISLGLEAGLNVDAQGACRMGAFGASGCKVVDGEAVGPVELLDYARAGAFVRYEWDRGELSLSVGALGDKFSAHDDAEIAPYMTLNWLTQF